jgi:putative colanic acid biosynthesis UDP-glucose lipid carrier transferase
MSDDTVREVIGGCSDRRSSIFLDPILGSQIIVPQISEAAEKYLASRSRRALELAISVGLVFVLAPLLCAIALAVRMTSRGPVLFRQLRYGERMVPFELLKFRSMYWTDEQEQTVKQATRGDSRVTPLGHVLRCTSMDELPQLFNVIRGDMSLIGPRPHAIQHDVYYRDLIPNYCARFGTRPGLTGLAQVSGARGCTPRVEDMRRRIELDLVYLSNASILLDCRILVKTVKEVFKSDMAF